MKEAKLNLFFFEPIKIKEYRAQNNASTLISVKEQKEFIGN